MNSAYLPGDRGWVKVKNCDYWRWELEREGAFSSRRERQFVSCLRPLKPRGGCGFVRLRAAWLGSLKARIGGTVTTLMPTQRRERNQRLFREVNERIREASGTFGLGYSDKPLDFICECGDADCTDILPLTLDEYGKTPRGGPHFLVKPGHQRSSQRVLERTGSYVLVEDHAAVTVRAWE